LDTAVITNEVFAIFVEESPAVWLGAVGDPVSAGDASGAYVLLADDCVRYVLLADDVVR
jgi:hypothetical protein